MVPDKLPKTILLLMLSLLLTTTVAAEPLRVLVPEFIGKEPLSQHVRTSVYFELIKAFRAVDTPDKGAWILYGQQPLEQASHDAVLAAATWPSVRADLAVWGKAHQYADGVVVQLQLTLTPLLKKRQVRPELWAVSLNTKAGVQRFELDIPGQFYEFEPLLLNREAIVGFQDPQGMPLYSKRKGGSQIGRLGEVIRFYEIHEDGVLIATDGKKGWVRTRSLADRESEAISFSKGMVRLLRGDWRGAQRSFSQVLENSAIPQKLRIHSLLYLGLANEKGGGSGRQEFAAAYGLNRLDRTAAHYLLMSRVAEIARYQRQNKTAAMRQAQQRLAADLAATRILFDKNDQWYRRLAALVP